MRKNLHDLRLVLPSDTKNAIHEEKLDKWNFITTKTCSAKDMLKRMKRQDTD